ncbi:MAG TPA: hypothetical protein ENJ90_08515 [Devosia sp.]|nr:hypothetical protein [Devosia sp.]
MNKARAVGQETGFRTLFLWIVWASTAIVVYFGLYLDTNLWEFLKQDVSKITWVIMGLFGVGMFISLVLTLRITSEAYRAGQLAAIAQRHSLKGIKPSKRVTRAVERFFISLKQVLERNDRPDVEALVDVELGPYYRTSHSVEVMGNLLITLGLIGTVIGLTLTLTGLTTSLDALGQDQERLLRGLRRAMGGMGTAFYTTLLGSVLGGVLLRVFALITDHGIESLAAALKKICMVYCAADINPTVERGVRSLNAEITTLGDNVNDLMAAIDQTTSAMHQFREEAERLARMSEDEEGARTSLRDSVVLQQYYSDLLKEEIKTLNKINRSWWFRLKRAFSRG